MKDIRKIATKSAPEAIGPYSQAVVVDGYMFCSGQIAIDPSTNTLVDGGIKEQTKQVLNNLQAILSESGVTFGNVVRVEIYLVDMNDFEEVNNLYGEVFNKEPLPARVTVGVASLPKGALVEMSCITVI